MNSFGDKVRSVRKDLKLTLKQVSENTGIDIAILSKLENGKRKGSVDQVKKLAVLYGLDVVELLRIWQAGQIAYQLKNEEDAEKILRVAEAEVTYFRNAIIDSGSLIQKVVTILSKDLRIRKAWLFGSILREDFRVDSDVDIIIEVDNKSDFTYFDLAEIQFKLSEDTNREIDVGFSNTIRSVAKSTIDQSKLLIYEKK